MVEHSGLDITCLNKYCNSSSSSSSSDRDKKLFSKIRVSLTENYPQKNAEVLSAQYGANVLLIGVSLMLGLSHHMTVKEKHMLGFITALMLLQLLWMLCYIIRRQRHGRLPPERDVHAAASWIRGGLTMLAVLSLIMDAFRIGQYIGYRACVSAALGVFPVIHALHTISQVHFLWFHIKDVIKKSEIFERFGVIHAVFTNLLLWCYGVMTESEHFLKNYLRRLSALGLENITTLKHHPPCNCSTNACEVFSTSLYYLFPFNIEYHIFVSAMLFVMWKNIGRTLDHHTNRKMPPTPTTGLIIGPILGLAALASAIGVLVVYSLQIAASVATREAALTMFYWYLVVLLALMCIAGGLGLLVFRAEGLPMDVHKNPARQLDVQLLLGSSVGSWLMAWCSVVAASASHSRPPYRWSGLTYALLLVLEKYIQNLFIMESLYRRRREASQSRTVEDGLSAAGIFVVGAGMAPPYDGIVNRAFESQDKALGGLEKEQVGNGQMYDCNGQSSDMALPGMPGRNAKPSRKREILKNITVFLFMCNISLWILPAFGCRPQYENSIEQETFGFTIWSSVLNFAIPINLFYRMHSVASLFEVFRKV